MLPKSPIRFLPETVEGTTAYYDMVHHRNPHDSPRGTEPPRDFPVFRAGGRVPAWMVVHEDDRRRALRDRRGEARPRVNEAAVQDAHRDARVPQDAVLDVQQDGEDRPARRSAYQVAVPFEHARRGLHRFGPRNGAGQGPSGEFEHRFPPLPHDAVGRFLLPGDPAHLLPTYRKGGAKQGRLFHPLERPPGAARPSPHPFPGSDDARKPIQIPFQKIPERFGIVSAIISVWIPKKPWRSSPGSVPTSRRFSWGRARRWNSPSLPSSRGDTSSSRTSPAPGRPPSRGQYRQAFPGRSAASSSRATCSPRTWSASTSSTRTRGVSPFPPALFSRTSSSPTRSSGAIPGPRAPCWRR